MEVVVRLMKIVLDEGDFRDLVAGKTVTTVSNSDRGELQIVLSDIGWDRMLDALAHAMTERAVGPDVMRQLMERQFRRVRADDCNDD
jgi:hypothetical protein